MDSVHTNFHKKRVKVAILLVLLLATMIVLISIFSIKKDNKNDELFDLNSQKWGYITVRPQAHMFWWLYKTTHPKVTKYTERPLIIWLQGGPGASSTGYGNFGEIGPLDEDLNPRNTTWIKNYNVLFVDNPVGAGFSYVEASDAYVTDNQQIAKDFLVFLRGFYKAVPELKKSTLYIFGESYGGKMTVQIALEIDRAIKNGSLDVKLAGIGLGDSWVSPEDNMLSYASYLLNIGFIDSYGYGEVQKLANYSKELLDKGSHKDATTVWKHTMAAMMRSTSGVYVYNILEPNLNKEEEKRVKIDSIMNHKVKFALNYEGNYSVTNGTVYNALLNDFMVPVTNLVELLLNTTDIQIVVYTGQLDLIVNVPGTLAWVNKLQFTKLQEYQNAERRPIIVNGVIEGYCKKGGNLAVHWVNRAGHMVPADNPTAMSFIVKGLVDGL